MGRTKTGLQTEMNFAGGQIRRDFYNGGRFVTIGLVVVSGPLLVAAML
jgi:hypothetical protein